MNQDDTYLTPYIFTRHKLPLHALLIQNQPWFCARDLSRLLHIYLNERMLRKHWNNQPWIRLQDVPLMVVEREEPKRPVTGPWWKRASRMLQSL